MTRRTKLELEINRPVEVELLFDEPISGESQYGNYFMYALENKGIEYSYFAPDEVHRELINLKKGDKAVLTKMVAQKGNRVITTYDVQIPNIVKTKPKAEFVSIGEAIEELLPNEVNEEISSHDKFYDIMKLSYSDALQINSEVNGITSDVVRIAITLFIQRSKTI